MDIQKQGDINSVIDIEFANTHVDTDRFLNITGTQCSLKPEQTGYILIYLSRRCLFHQRTCLIACVCVCVYAHVCVSVCVFNSRVCSLCVCARWRSKLPTSSTPGEQPLSRRDAHPQQFEDQEYFVCWNSARSEKSSSRHFLASAARAHLRSTLSTGIPRPMEQTLSREGYNTIINCIMSYIFQECYLRHFC